MELLITSGGSYSTWLVCHFCLDSLHLFNATSDWFRIVLFQICLIFTLLFTKTLMATTPNVFVFIYFGLAYLIQTLKVRFELNVGNSVLLCLK